MNFFQLIKQVLDDAWEQMTGSSAERYASIRAELSRLAPFYANLQNYGNIDYSNSVTRFAYVYRYVTS